VTQVFLDGNSAPSSMEEWNGETITDFQEDLFRKVKAKVSEKWFYTYFKNEPDKLPRIDMLNLLSSYVGHKNWNDFKSSQSITYTKTSHKRSRAVTYIALLMIPLLAYAIYGLNSKNEFHFCFVDSIRNEAITKIQLDIKIIQEDESPLYFKTDSMGCFTYTTKKDRIQFIVQSPFHKTDTITRSIDANQNQTVHIDTDDYALMLSYYTNGNVKDWNKHKAKLQAIIAEDAQIYQLLDDSMNVELYSKDDFIRLLTTPTNSLKNIEILDKTLSKGKIVNLKFMVR